MHATRAKARTIVGRRLATKAVDVAVGATTVRVASRAGWAADAAQVYVAAKRVVESVSRGAVRLG